ncbi:MAG: hypothetical protein J6Y60_05340 [Treponema sp.]|nr:hypothetical protein [Treponema sp.]
MKHTVIMLPRNYGRKEQEMRMELLQFIRPDFSWISDLDVYKSLLFKVIDSICNKILIEIHLAKQVEYTFKFTGDDLREITNEDFGKIIQFLSEKGYTEILMTLINLRGNPPIEERKFRL